MRSLLTLISVAFLSLPSNIAAADHTELGGLLKPWFECLAGTEQPFQLDIEGKIQIAGSMQSLQGSLKHYGKDEFDLQLVHQDYAIELRRRPDQTAFALPKHRVAYIGSGPSDPRDHLETVGLVDRIISPGSSVSLGKLIPWGDPNATVLMLSGMLGVSPAQVDGRWKMGANVSLRFKDNLKNASIEVGDSRISLTLLSPTGKPPRADDWPGLSLVELPRSELERTLCRGVRRALEVLAPSQSLRNPRQGNRETAHGRLQWNDGQRIVVLSGTPEDIGRAHGELLHDESWRCIDSVLYAFGTVKVIESGRWFRHDLEQAYAQLESHIPEDHKLETRALAAALKCDPRLMECLNVFPELFHCSGFAVFDSATKDGKLYHGRVLDYMTTIGLQDAATTFIVSPKDKITFANVGYGGFIGSVSGMNMDAISLGEMGGRGEGKWNGVPMATLMRRALEECHTLDEVMALWKASPRTCEYYYVFADGKTNRAVGVAATPETLQFVAPGTAHELLGEGIRDSVVLSAGDRLTTLRARVQERHGSIDVATAQWLMSRPVAMQSNLHNVLFVPADRVLYVANADHDRPAAECKYTKIDLKEMVRE